MTAPILVFGWGNPSRGDDALGPNFIDQLEALSLPGVECLTDFQLQVEHAIDLLDRQRVLFVDASVNADPPFTLGRIHAAKDGGFSTHAISPQAVLQTYLDLYATEVPESWLLAIRGENFDLGTPLSENAEKNLTAAVGWAIHWLNPQPS